MLLLSVVLPVMIHSRMSFVLNYHKVGGVCQFNYFMGTLLRERQADLYRSKGVLSIEGQGDTKFVFQVTPAHPPPPPDWLRPDSTPFKGVTAQTKA